MGKKGHAFRELERFMTTLLFFDLAFFLLYLLFSCLGVIVMKAICAIIGLLVAGFCLWILYRNKALLRPRTLWLTCGFSCQAILILVSLICNYPAP